MGGVAFKILFRKVCHRFQVLILLIRRSFASEDIDFKTQLIKIRGAKSR